jgi:hypothetical protein
MLRRCILINFTSPEARFFAVSGGGEIFGLSSTLADSLFKFLGNPLPRRE